MLTYVRRSKASLVNMFVTFCGKLECSFLTATMLVLYLHFLKTAKVPRSKTNYESYNWQIFWPKDTKGNRKFMTFRFSSVLIRFLTFLFIFVSIGLQTTHLSYDKKRCQKYFVMWYYSYIFQCQNLYQTWDITSSSQTPCPNFI